LRPDAASRHVLVSEAQNHTTADAGATAPEMPQGLLQQLAAGNAVTLLKEAQGLPWRFVCVYFGCISQGGTGIALAFNLCIFTGRLHLSRRKRDGSSGVIML